MFLLRIDIPIYDSNQLISFEYKFTIAVSSLNEQFSFSLSLFFSHMDLWEELSLLLVFIIGKKLISKKPITGRVVAIEIRQSVVIDKSKGLEQNGGWMIWTGKC